VSVFELRIRSVRPDVNGDRQVDLTDLALLLARFGSSNAAHFQETDGDGDVDLHDLTTMLSSFGSSCG
jgi:hypothetical protein